MQGGRLGGVGIQVWRRLDRGVLVGGGSVGKVLGLCV